MRRRAARADARARATSCEIEHESRTNRCAARTDACAAAASALSARAGAMRNAGVGSCTGVGTCAGVGSRVGIGSRVNVGSCVSVISCRLARLVLARPRTHEPSAHVRLRRLARLARGRRLTRARLLCLPFGSHSCFGSLSASWCAGVGCGGRERRREEDAAPTLDEWGLRRRREGVTSRMFQSGLQPTLLRFAHPVVVISSSGCCPAATQ